MFTSYRSGSAQFYEAGFPQGEIRQLTASPGIHPFSAAYSRSGDHIFFVRGGSIVELDRSTFSERVIVDPASPRYLQRADSPEQIDAWNRIWAFFEKHLNPNKGK